jgi:uncharacterized RDD family membrane protein YckC
MSDSYYVETPEIVAVAYDVAGAGSRCLAAVIDTLLILIVQVAIGAALFIAGAQLGLDTTGASVVTAVYALAAFAVLWGYYLLFELIWNGQSPGKRLIGLRVVREGGRPISFAASAVRNLIRIVDFLPLFYGLGTVVMFVDPRSRRLGDLAAGTLVVREGAPVTLASLTDTSTPVIVPPRQPDAPPTPLLPHVNVLTPADYELVQDFLRRRAQLTPARRSELAARLTAALRARLNQAELSGDPERFLEHVVREYRVWQAINAPPTPTAPAPVSAGTTPPGAE